MFLGKGILKICSKFTGEHPCRSAISVKFTPFLKNTFGWLLLCFQNRLQHPCSSAGFFSKVKLWKVVIRYKCLQKVVINLSVNVFELIASFSQNISFLRLQLFFSLSTHPASQLFQWQSTRFLLLIKHFFFFLQPLPGKGRKFIFAVEHLKNSFNTIMQLINRNYA